MQGRLIQADHQLRRIVRTAALIASVIIIGVLYWSRDYEQRIAELEQPLERSLFEDFNAADASGDVETRNRLGAAIDAKIFAREDQRRALYRDKWRLEAAVLLFALPLGAWLTFAGANILRAGQYPAPGARVLRDAYVVNGSEANTAAAVRLVPGIAILGGTVYLIWAIWQHAESVGLPLI